MSLDLNKVEYYNITVNGNAGEGSKLLSVFAGVGVNLLAFKAVPVEPMRTQFSLFPDDSSKMNDGAKKTGLHLDGPHFALLIKGYDDESGALADIYEKLSQADIIVYESSGIANIKGSYGVVLYLKQEDCEKAMEALNTCISTSHPSGTSCSDAAYPDCNSNTIRYDSRSRRHIQGSATSPLRM
jgi:hypothetical protein